MKDKLLTYAFIVMMVFVLFAFAWPIFRDVVSDQVQKIDDAVPTVTMN
jgi:hypothetical protein